MSYYDKADLIYLMSGAAGSGGNGTSKVYSLKGDTDIVYNRGADIGATRIDKDGLIEKGRQNEITNSNDFSVGGGSGGWYKTQNTPNNRLAVLTSGQSGYDGSTNAWKLEAGYNPDTADDLESYIRQPNTNSGIQTFSVYAKAGSTPYMRLIGLGTVIGGSTSNANGWFHLSGSGSVPTKANVVDATIERVGTSDWYRCAITFNRALVTGVRIQIADGDGVDFANSAKVTEGDYIFIQNAQLEYGTVATGYITSGSSTGKSGLTIDEPRFNYPALGSGCPKLLMEQKRTNKVTYSEYFGAWTATDVTVENNAIISPEGVKNAAKLVIDNGVSSGAEIRVNGVAVLNTTSYTFSLFAKAGEFNQIQLDLSDSRFGNANVTATLTGSGSVTSGGGSTDAYIEQLKDGWYRIVLVGTTTAAGNSALILRLQVNSINGTGDGSKGIYVYGAQFEHGVHVGGDDDGNEIDAPYPTSYIPTHGTAVTRDQDGHTNPFLVNADADQFSFFTHTSQGEEVGSNRGPRLYHTSGSKSSNAGYYIGASGDKTYFLDSNAGSGSNRNISSVIQTPSGQDHDDIKYLFCVDNTELRSRLFVDGELVADTAKPESSSGQVVRAMSQRADFDKLRLTSSADVGEPDEITSVMTFDSSLSNTEGKILTGATNYVSFGAMVDALTNYTTYE